MLRKRRDLIWAVLILMLILSEGCQSVKDYLGKSPLQTPVKKTKLTFQKEADISLPGNPWGIALDPENARAFVVSNASDCVYVVDLAKKEVTGKIAVGMGPWEVAFDRRRGRLYVTDGDENRISVVDLETGKETLKVDVDGKIPYGIAYSENLDQIYTANSDSDNVSIIDAETLTLKGNMETGDYPYSLCVDDFNRKVMVTNNFDGTVSVLYPETGRERRITAGGNVSGITFDTKNLRAFVAGTLTDQVVVIDSEKDEVVGALKTSEHPIDVCVDTENRYLYTVHRESGTLSVISPHRKGSIATIKLGKEPVRLAIDTMHKLIVAVNNGSGSISLIRYHMESKE